MLKFVTRGHRGVSWSWYSLHRCPPQLTACNLPGSRSSGHLTAPGDRRNQGLLPHTTSHVLPTPGIQVLAHRLHESGIALRQQVPLKSFTDQPPTSTHVFRIKTKVPGDPKDRIFSVRSLFSVPGPYMAYGLGGLIPFMSAPYYMHLIGAFSPGVAHAQLVYGACILSFLGGVSWGDHLKSPVRATMQSLRYSILLPLVAWPAVLLYPNPGSFAVMIGGIVYAGMKDVRSESYPHWFKSLRFLLTSLVALSLSTSLIFSFTKEVRGGGADDEDASEENSSE